MGPYKLCQETDTVTWKKISTPFSKQEKYQPIDKTVWLVRSKKKITEQKID